MLFSIEASLDQVFERLCCVDRHEEEDRQRKQEEAGHLKVEERIQEYRRLLIETCLTNKCPRCRSAWVDYDGCDAVICGNRACGAGFCGLCLKGVYLLTTHKHQSDHSTCLRHVVEDCHGRYA
jgi:hypothetical protein